MHADNELVLDQTGRPPSASDVVQPWCEEVFDLHAALVHTRGNLALLQGMAAVFVEDSSGLLAQLAEALAAGDSRAVERVAHGLRGAARYLSASKVVDAAQRLEDLACRKTLADAPAALAALERQTAELLSALKHLRERNEG